MRPKVRIFIAASSSLLEIWILIGFFLHLVTYACDSFSDLHSKIKHCSFSATWKDRSDTDLITKPEPYRSQVNTSSGFNRCDYVNHCVSGSTNQLKFVNELSFNFNCKPFENEAPPDRRLLPNCTYKNENNELLIWTTPQWYKYQFRHTTEHSHTTGTYCIILLHVGFAWHHYDKDIKETAIQ